MSRLRHMHVMWLGNVTRRYPPNVCPDFGPDCTAPNMSDNLWAIFGSELGADLYAISSHHQMELRVLHK